MSKCEIVCLCGSSRFADVAAVVAWELEKQGIIVFGLRLLPAWYTQSRGHVAEDEGVAEILDELHLHKIDMADRVLVINLDGDIGERTGLEIQYAEKHNKPIGYLEPLKEVKR